MSEQELNKKLAEWTGFKIVLGVAVPYWLDPAGGSITRSTDWPLDFTNSLDACFKWLVPKLQDKGYNIELYAYEHKGYKATVYEEVFSQRGSDGFDPWLDPISQVEDDNPSLALCLAIEKLIDKQTP